jgi:protocatechuate 3,4-dioxygenase beta subunit
MDRTRNLTRRSLLQAALAAPALLVACKTPRAAARDAAPTPSIPDHDDHPAKPDAAAAPTAACADVTEDNIEGPFFKPGAPHRAVLVAAGDRGTRLDLRGTVTDLACRPLAGVEMEIWHADADGTYDLRGFKFRGALTTSARGEYHVATIIPGRYLNGDRFRPAHLHFKLHARGVAPLTTQLYFPGDPYNDGDPFIRRSLIMRLDGGDGRFDFVLAA